MKESHRKGLANHPDPESCVRGGNATGEALTGAHAGRVLSCEITPSREPTPLPEAEGHTGGGASASRHRSLRSRRPRCMRGNSSHGTREVPWVPVADVAAGRSGKASGRNPDAYAHGKSDGRVVPRKRANKGRLPWHGRDAVTLADERASQR